MATHMQAVCTKMSKLASWK